MNGRALPGWFRDGPVRQVLDALNRDGEEARPVGGAVRNWLIGLPPGDIDIATTLAPEAVTTRCATASPWPSSSATWRRPTENDAPAAPRPGMRPLSTTATTPSRVRRRPRRPTSWDSGPITWQVLPPRARWNRSAAADVGRVPGRSGVQSATHLSTDAEVDAAVSTPPADTRAWLRGRVVEAFGEQVVSASWDALVLRLPRAGRVVRVAMPDPLALGRDGTEALVSGGDVDSLVAGLGA